MTKHIDLITSLLHLNYFVNNILIIMISPTSSNLHTTRRTILCQLTLIHARSNSLLCGRTDLLATCNLGKNNPLSSMKNCLPFHHSLSQFLLDRDCYLLPI